MPISGHMVTADGVTAFVSGQIDRLVVMPDEVLIADYKTNRHVPADASGIPPDHLAQLAVYRRLVSDIYPDRRVTAALLWTSAPKLMPVPGDALDAVLASLKSTDKIA
ncbi:PD-(D/E)XK nuclease family protein [Pannonibacter sp. Pt2-lr]